MKSDRDRILEQALKHELRAAETPPAGVCLDADTLGAWTDGGLDPAAMAAVEAHVSTCARCQAVVNVIVRSTPSTVGTVRTVRTVRTLSSWWLAPIAAGAAAVTLWMVVPEQQELATAPPQSQAAKANEAPRAEPAPPAKDAAIEQPADRFARRENKVATDARRDRQQGKRAEERKEEAAALQETVTVGAASPSVAAAPPAPAAPPPPATPALRAPAELAALQDSARKLVAPPPGIDVTGQSAPSETVCWFVGRAGLVLLTTDAGKSFTRVDLAERIDLASVSAIDAFRATVTTTDGRRFRTEDGGKLWRAF